MEMQLENHILYEVIDGVGWMTLNRPNKKNAMTAAMRRQLYDAYADVKHNPAVRVGVITANGPAFCSGEDLFEEHASGTTTITSEELDRFQYTVHTPIIAAVNGPAYGQGTRFIFSSDIVIMAESAAMVWPQVRRGISSVSGPTVLTQRISWPRAMSYLLRGAPISAQECLHLGLANEVVTIDQLLPATKRWANELTECAPLAQRAIKEAARRGEALPMETRKAIANDIFNRTNLSNDAHEGVRSFKERRPPKWTGT